MEWGADWYIDKFTPKWRESGPNRSGDWAIGMTNYGGLLLLVNIGASKNGIPVRADGFSQICHLMIGLRK